jgi:hypothetical protein
MTARRRTTAAAVAADSVRTPKSVSPAAGAGARVADGPDEPVGAVVATVELVVAAVVGVELGVVGVCRARSAASRAGEPSGAVVGVAVCGGTAVLGGTLTVVRVGDAVDRSAASLAAEPSGALSAAPVDRSFDRSAVDATPKPAAETNSRAASPTLTPPSWLTTLFTLTRKALGRAR